MLSARGTVDSLIPGYLSLQLRSPRNVAAFVTGAAAVAGVTWYLLRRPRPTAEEMEHLRREQLAASGRITDGSIIDAPHKQEDPAAAQQVIVYNYRIGGVSYEAAQDVSALRELVRDVRTDLPIQVRYAPHNPANSIVVSESWSGLRLSADAPRPVLGIHREIEQHQKQAANGH
ncbi:DUF3592 domain-containing protein [Edaphobacter bradus]|uniref:DUF3592 domain-containing protein n=1 Tax=Edaphobacter bradus TaxID=2259016 RepID=UPI0021DFB9F9|nr:hypothetical protein [Edaphobacter bradus]